MHMKNEIFTKRTAEIRKILADEGFDALILPDSADVMYLTGFTGDDSWGLLASGAIYLVTDSRYIVQAKKQCKTCKIIERKGAMSGAVAGVLNKFSSIKKVAIDSRAEVRFFDSIRKQLSAKLKAVPSPVESLRAVKDNSEITTICKAAKIAQTALGKTLPRAYAGISEQQLAAILDIEMKNLGATVAFETIVAFGPNSAMPHHRPGARKLKKVDTILIDFGAKFNGYCSDMTRCFAVGKATKFYSEVYSAVFAAQSQAIKAVRAGEKINIVDNAARKVIKKAKLPDYGHGTGHGLGPDVHEKPIVSANYDNLLQKGNVITIEPAVYLPGKFGIRIEDDVVVTDKGCKILTPQLKTDKVPTLKIK